MKDEVEQMIQDKGKTAARITADDVENAIVVQTFINAGEASRNTGHSPHQSLDLLTICVLVLDNGFTVTGESACASPENFDAEIGRVIARRNAFSKAWGLLGFRLCDELAEQKRKQA